MGISTEGREEWTPEEVDTVLERVMLYSSSEDWYYRICRRLARELGRGVPANGAWPVEPVHTLLWKIATRYKNWADYAPTLPRNGREGQPFNYADGLILNWAFLEGGDAAKRAAPPDNEHIARVLARTPKEVRDWRFARKSMGRGSGFGIIAPEHFK